MMLYFGTWDMEYNYLRKEKVNKNKINKRIKRKVSKKRKKYKR